MVEIVEGRFRSLQKKYPEIKIRIEQIPWNDLDTKVNAAVAAKQGPDLLFEADREAEYPRRGAILPIDDLMADDFFKKHKFYEVRPLADNHLYWVHCSIMGPILYTNKKLLAEKGLKPADVPTTWNDFGKFCQQLTKIENGTMVQAGFGFNGYARYIWNDMMYQQGVHVYDQKKSYVNNPGSAMPGRCWSISMIRTRSTIAPSWLRSGFGTSKTAIAQVWTWFGSTSKPTTRISIGPPPCTRPSPT
jgi:multiple sugar transport system substrate-binding protein